MNRYQPPIFESPPKRILIIKPSAIGDVVHTLPILNLIRRQWPKSHVSWLITPACAGLLQGHPQIDELILFDRKRYASSWRSLKTARALFEFTKSLRSHNFDLVIDLQGLFRSGWLTWQTRAPHRVGSTSARELGGIFCNHIARIEKREQHAIDRYLTVAEFLGLGRTPVEFHFATDDSDRKYIQQLLPEDQPFAVILPTTNWATKRWPIEKFAALVDPLRDRFGLSTVLSGGPDVAEMSSLFPRAINLGGKTNLRQLVALLERADLVLAGDTGPMHIASALGRPMVTMFGPTSPIQTGPYQRLDTVVRVDIPCSPCFSRTCSHHSCLRWLEIEPVLDLAKQQLGGKSLRVLRT